VLADDTKADEFTEFVSEFEQPLRQSLTAAYGSERGREAAAEALAYGWEHWDRIGVMSNPAGYLYRVATDRARRMAQRRYKSLPTPIPQRDPWVEPELGAALENLPLRQRTVIGLLHGYDWSMGEVAELFGVSKSTVQNHEYRGMKKLRRHLKVER
jgi:RNA polymerase sigma factor (sigma-70 family)